MSLLDKTVSDLEMDEGWRASPYKDHLGYLTIGYGFLIDERKDIELPKEVGRFWLAYLVAERKKALDARLPWLKDQPEDVQRALLNMSYQLGIAGLLGFKNMLKELQLGNRPAAANHAKQSTWYTQTPDRAKRVIALIRG